MSSDPDPIITMDDVRNVFCVTGVRRWLRDHSLNVRDFTEQGIRASVLRKMGEDGLVDRILMAREEAEDGR